jgi:hypothetical protein
VSHGSSNYGKTQRSIGKALADNPTRRLAAYGRRWHRLSNGLDTHTPVVCTKLATITGRVMGAESMRKGIAQVGRTLAHDRKAVGTNQHLYYKNRCMI